MDARPHTVLQLFAGEECFVVPIFQRPYVWQEEKNWQPLWNDVLSMVGVAADDPATSPHFLGAVVLDYMNTPPDAISSRQVVDGQQRLTTLQVLLCAVRGALITTGQQVRFPNALRKLTRNQDQLSEAENASFKVWPTLTDREGFSAIVNADTSEQIDDLVAGATKASVLIEAYRYFYEQTLRWLEDVEDDIDTNLELLVTVLQRRLQLVVINLDKNDNAQVIFESLNDRGTPLLPSDLIKNFVFQLLESHGVDVEEVFQQYWRRLETAFWKEEVRQGRLNRSRLDAFFSHYLTMRTGKEVLSPALFNQFKNLARPMSGDDLVELVAEISNFSLVYRQILQRSGRSRDNRMFRTVAILDTTVLTPILMHLLINAEKDDRAEAFQWLESWLVRRQICKSTSKNYNRFLLDLLQKLKTATDGFADVVRDHLLANQSESGRWPSDDEVQGVLISTPIYRRLTRARMKLVLLGCDTGLGSQNQCNHLAAYDDRLEIEHLIPKTSSSDGTSSDFLDSIGNLTLLKGPLGTRANTSSWETRQIAFAEDRAFGLNRNLPSVFGEDQVLQRSLVLAEALCQHWPHPETPTALQSSAVSDAPAAAEAKEVSRLHLEQLWASVETFFEALPVGTIVAAEEFDIDYEYEEMLVQLPTVSKSSVQILRSSDGMLLEKTPVGPVVESPPISEYTAPKPPPAALADSPPSPQAAPPRIDYPATRVTYDASISALLRSGFLKPGDRLYHHQTRIGKTVGATVESDGTINAGGNRFTAPSTALGFLVGHSINGWTGWRVERTRETLDEIRRRAALN
ncbi:UNVERIFIED_CONTAM: uncharacterized protein DUF1524 [Williamsia faeni]